MRPLVFVDVETGGLDAKNDALLEVAAVCVFGDTPASVIHRYVLPVGNITPRARELNGYDEDVWRERGAVPLKNAVRDLAAFFKACGEKAFFCGHNPRFDYDFLTRAFARVRRPFPATDYHLLDTASLAVPLLLAGDVESLSLKSLCEFMGTIPQPDHSAINDVRATLSLFHGLIGLYVYKAGEDGNVQ